LLHGRDIQKVRAAIRKYKAVLLDHPIIGVDGLFILLIPFLSLGFALGGAELRRQFSPKRFDQQLGKINSGPRAPRRSIQRPLRL